jgi:hypothetical protein
MDGERPHAERPSRLYRFVGVVGLADIGQRDMGAFACETFDDGGTYATATAGD